MINRIFLKHLEGGLLISEDMLDVFFFGYRGVYPGGLIRGWEGRGL